MVHAKQLYHIEVQRLTPAHLYQAATVRPADREILRRAGAAGHEAPGLGVQSASHNGDSAEEITLTHALESVSCDVAHGPDVDKVEPR